MKFEPTRTTKYFGIAFFWKLSDVWVFDANEFDEEIIQETTGVPKPATDDVASSPNVDREKANRNW